MLVISYGSRELAHRCTKLELAQEWLGPADAQALVDLIADAEAMESAAALIEFYEADISENDSLSIVFSPRYRALLEPIGHKVPRGDGKKPMWAQVRRLLLVNVLEP